MRVSGEIVTCFDGICAKADQRANEEAADRPEETDDDAAAEDDAADAARDAAGAPGDNIADDSALESAVG